jgi:acyl-CoA thioesterase
MQNPIRSMPRWPFAMTTRACWDIPIAATGTQVGPYGGITAAVILQSILRRPERLGDPLSLTVNYAGPVAEGEFELEVSLLRSNRTTQHWSVLLRQGSERQVVINAIAVFALRRDAWSQLEAVHPQVPPPESIPP